MLEILSPALRPGDLVAGDDRPGYEGKAVAKAIRVFNPRNWLRFAGWGAASLLLTLAGARISLFDRWWLDGAISLAWLVAVAAAFDRLRQHESLWLGQTAVAGLALAALALISRQPALVAASLAASAATVGLRAARRPQWLRGVAASGVLALALAAGAVLLRFTDRPASGTWMIPLVMLGVPLANLAYWLAVQGLRRAGVPGGPADLLELVEVSGRSLAQARAVLAGAGAALGAFAVVLSRLDPGPSNLAGAAVAGAVLVLGLPQAVRRFQPPEAPAGSWLRFLLFAPHLERRLDFLLIACGLSVVFYAEMGRVEFHPDESFWIATSDLFEPFVRGDFASSVWDEVQLTSDDPHVVRYLIGLGRLAGGYRAADLNSRWDFRYNAATNVALGAVPGPGLLWWSRLPMAILAVLYGLGVYGLVDKAAGRLGGYLAVFLFVGNPYMRAALPRALGEAPLLTFVLLAALAATRALEGWGRAASRPFRVLLGPLAWFGLTGVLCGLAGAAKLNGLQAAFAAAALALLAALRRASGAPTAARQAFGAGAPALVLLATGAIFVAVNPYLYPDPLARTGRLFTYRWQAIEAQQAQYADAAIRGLEMRVAVVPQRVLQDYAAFRFPGAWVVNSLLFTAGILYLARGAWRYLFNGGGSAASLALLLFGFATAAPSLLTPLDWDRYYLLPVAFSTIGVAVAIACGLETARDRLGPFPGRTRLAK
jgi:hypothetical protein